MKNKNAFTLVELIVSMVVIIILSGIAFVSYSSYVGDARDTQRTSDLQQISSALKLSKQSRGYFPDPGESFNIVYDTTNIVALQGFFDTNIRLNTIDNLPYDPKLKIPYTYSVTNNKQEFQLATTLENQVKFDSLVVGDYKSVSKNILPGLILATNETAGTDVEIKDGVGDGTTNRDKFVFSNQIYNLIYTYESPYSASSDGTSLETILSELEEDGTFWQSSDYRSCLEIEEAGKLIIPLNASAFEYQIVSSTGALTNTGCTN